MDKNNTINSKNILSENEKTKSSKKSHFKIRTILLAVLIVGAIWSINKFKDIGKALANYNDAMAKVYKESEKTISTLDKSWEKFWYGRI